MKAKLTLAMFMALFISFSVYAKQEVSYAVEGWWNWQPPQHLYNLKCAPGEVAIMQEDKRWACAANSGTSLDKDGIEALVGTHTVDTSAATECGPGEVLVANGNGGDCVPLGPFIRLTVGPAASACPCLFLDALSSSHSWDIPWTECGSSSTTDPPRYSGSFFYIEDRWSPDVHGMDQLHVWQQPFDDVLGRPVVCNVVRNGAVSDPSIPVDDGQELDDCIEDLQTVAIALGVSCPPPPVFAPQP